MVFPFGPEHFIKLEHLHIILNTVSKDKDKLTASTLNPNDRQNFDSVMRLCDEKVIELLKLKVKGSQATVISLEMIHVVLDSYIRHHASLLVPARDNGARFRNRCNCSESIGRCHVSIFHSMLGAQHYLLCS